MKKLDMKVEKQFVTNMALNFTHALVEKVAGQDGKMKEMVEVEVVAVVVVAVAAAAVAEEVQAAAEELHHHQVEMEAAEVEDQKVEAALGTLAGDDDALHVLERFEIQLPHLGGSGVATCAIGGEDRRDVLGEGGQIGRVHSHRKY